MNNQQTPGILVTLRTSTRMWVLVSSCLLAALAMIAADAAFARGVRGGGSGAMARTSVSGANRSESLGAARANAGSAGNRTNNQINGGNTVSGGNQINAGNRVNTGDINIDRGDVNIDVDGNYGVRPGYVRYPVAAGVAVGAAVGAAIAVGSMYVAVPPGCPIVHTYATPYYYCGGYYYQQQMQGDNVVFVVVKP